MHPLKTTAQAIERSFLTFTLVRLGEDLHSPRLKRLSHDKGDQMMRLVIVICAMALVTSMSAPASSAESKNAKIARALSAGPSSIQAGATVMDMGANGKVTVLRKGTNGFTCFAGHTGVVGDDPFCADKESMVWAGDWMAHHPKPTNAKPGIIYMLAGGADWSATDPWATKGTPIHEPPHWMIMWPNDPKTSGLSSKESSIGTWIMWANTPYAHLMINQKP